MLFHFNRLLAEAVGPDCAMDAAFTSDVGSDDTGAEEAVGAEDAGAGEPEPEGDEPQAGEDEGQTAEASSDDGDDIGDDDDLDDGELPPEPPTAEQWRKMQKRYRKAISDQREAKRLKQRIGDADIDQLRRRAEQADAYEAAAEKSPRVKELFGLDSDDKADDAPTAGLPDSFDRKKLPFDPDDSDINSFFADQAEAVHTLAAEVAELRKARENDEKTASERTEQAISRTWADHVSRVVRQIPNESTRAAYKAAMAQAFERDRHKHQVGTVSAWWEKNLGINSRVTQGKPKPPAKREEGERERVASRAQNQPRHQAGGGRATSPKRGKEMLADVEKRLKRLPTA